MNKEKNLKLKFYKLYGKVGTENELKQFVENSCGKEPTLKEISKIDKRNWRK